MRNAPLALILAAATSAAGCGASSASSAPPDADAVPDAVPDAPAPPDADDDGAPDAITDAITDASPTDGGWTEPPDPPGSFRSALFPRGWVPVEAGGAADAQGRFLPDFSYAGYHQGARRPPYDAAGVTSATVDAALGDGKVDATAAIQAKVDAACAAGGGVVLLPAGTYRVRLPSATASAALTISCSRVVLRGEGPTKSRLLFDDAARARQRSVVAIQGAGNIRNGALVAALAKDTVAGQRVVELASPGTLAVGDWVTVRVDMTAALRAEHRMDAAGNGTGADFWPTSGFAGLLYPRRVRAIAGSSVTLDAPLREPLRTRDGARVERLSKLIEESGLEHLGVGMVQGAAPYAAADEAAHDDDYATAGTPGYLVHDARAITVNGAHDAWLYDVASFEPTQNGGSGVHVLSHGVLLGYDSFRVRVEGCAFGRPQYRGGGGNGYLFHLQGSDELLASGSATGARHGLTINHAASGNVFRAMTLRASRLTDDTHRFLANANLWDGTVLDGDWLSSVNRGDTSTGAGFTGTSGVFWNTRVTKNHASAKGCAIETAQWGYGYVIGTRAPAGQSAKVCTASVTNSTWAALDQGAPVDFVEGEALGESLSPASLYDAQRARRCAVEALGCD